MPLYIACEQCRRKITDRHRMVIWANRTYCDDKCLEIYKENQQRIYQCEAPAPNFGYTPAIWDP